MSRFIPLAALCTFAAYSAMAQTSRGTVTGILTDPQAAVVPGVEVELAGTQTGVKRTTTANESGLYRFDAVDPGEYSVSVSAAGFQTFVRRGVIVQGGRIASLDIRLEVGETRSIIEVQAGTTGLLEYEASIRGDSIASRTIIQLPFATRDVAQLGLTLPGVSTNRFGFGVGTFSVNGSRGRSNNFMIDGTDNNDVSIAGQLITVTNPDAVSEVSVQTSNFDAEFGRAGGAIVNTITKSGTNELHGSLSYLLDATNDDAITNTQSLNPDIVKRGKPFPGTEQWYGVTVGGPIRRNQTFFFGSFQDQRQHSQNTNNLTVPTAAGRSTLDALYPKGRNARVDLYNQVTGGVTATAQPFNVTMGDGRPPIEFGTAIVPYANRYLDRQYLARIDHQISEHDQLAARYLDNRQDSPQGGATGFFPGFSTSMQYPSRNLVVSETHVLSPVTTNELRLAYNRADLGYPLDTANPLGRTLPLYTIAGGISPIGVASTFPQGRVVNNYAVQETVSHVRGTHTFRIGLSLNQQRSRQLAPIRDRGEIAYGNASGYSNFADFVDDFGGSAGAVSRDFGSPAYYPNFTRQAYFAQDHWRLTRDLALTLGVRYEYFGTPMNTLKKSSYSGIFNVDPVTLDGPYSQFTKVDPDKNNWAPVVGLAWSPTTADGLFGKFFGGKHSVFRAGYQIGYDSFFNNITSNAATATPNVISTTVPSSMSTANPRGVPNWSALMPVVARTPLAVDSQTLMTGNLVNPYQQKWSFGIQRDLPAGILLDISYVGSKGTRLYANEDFNPVVPASMQILPANAAAIPPANRTTRLDALQGARLIRTNGGSSIYHALQMSADRRLAKGLLFKACYTWSKAIDNASEIFGVTGSNLPQNTAVPSIYGGLRYDRSLSFFDRTHRAVFTYVYQLPFLGQQKGAFGRVFGGWQVSGITTFESGMPATVANGLDADGIGGSYDRPSFNPSGTAGVRAVYNTGSATGYVNPDAANIAIDPKAAMYIGLPANSGTAAQPTGNLGRNTARIPGINNFNLNLQKRIRIAERVNTEFRAEFYNLWNHPQYGIASVSPFAPAAGSISASVASSPAGRFLNPSFMDGGARVIRYQLRLTF
jgi:outer membrane receptor protein involved in Fe transport